MVGRRIAPISNAVLRALWLDPAETRQSIAAKAGCSYCAVYNRARAMGLPSRLTVRRRGAFLTSPLFEAMWRAGVSGYDMARHFGVAQSSISRAAAAADLPARRAGQAARMTLAQFRQTLLAAQMQLRRKIEIALLLGKPAPSPKVDLVALFPANPALPSVVSQAWLHLHSLGLTAAEAAQARGLGVRTANKWASQHGLRWASHPAAQAVQERAA